MHQRYRIKSTDHRMSSPRVRTAPDGPIKTFTLRNIKDSPPHHHAGRLLTLNDTVESFNRDLSQDEKRALTAFMFCL